MENIISSAIPEFKDDEMLTMLDQHGRIEYINESFLKKTNYFYNEIIGKNIDQFLLKTRNETQVFDVLGNKEKWTGELKILKKDGDLLYEKATMTPVFTEEKKLTNWLIRAEDITIFKKAEDALKVSDEFTKGLISAVPEMIFVFSTEGVFKRIITKNKTDLVFTEEEVVGKNIEELSFPAEMINTFKQKTNIILKNKSLEIFEYTLNTKGYEEYFEARITLLNEEEIIAVVRNITENKIKENDFQANRAKYMTLYSKSNDAIFIIENGVFVECNEKALEIFKLEKESDILGNTPYNFSPEYQPDGQLSKHSANSYIQKALDGKPQRFYWKHKQFDGVVFDAEVTLNRFDVLGKVYLQAVVKDITQQFIANAALERSEQRFRLFAELLPGIVYETDVYGVFTYINKAGFEIFGYSREDFDKGVHSLTAIAPEERDVAILKRKETLMSGIDSREEYTGIKKDGTRFPIEIYTSAIFEKGELTGTRGLVIDLSDHKAIDNALKESQQRYFMLFSKASDAIIIGHRRKVLDCNEKALELFGCTREEILNGWLPFAHEKETKLMFLEKLDSYNDRFSQGIPLVDEIKLQKKDGSEFDAEVTISQFNAGSRLLTQVFIRDISYLKKINIELREKERRISTLMNNLPGMAFRCTYNENWDIEYVSQGCYDLFGFTYDYFVNKKVTSFETIYHEDLHYVKESIRQAVTAREPYRLVYRITTSKKHTKWVLEQGEGVYNETNVPIAIEGFLTDITQQKEYELELRESQMKYYTLFSKANDAIVIMQDGVCVDCNEKTLQVFFCSFDDLIGNPLQKFYPEMQDSTNFSKEAEEKRIQKAINGKPQSYNWIFIRANQQQFHAEVGMNGFEVGGMRYIQFIIRDITERIINENKLRESRENYKRLVESIPDGIYIVMKRSFVYANNEGFKLLRVKGIEQLSEEYINSLLSEEQRQVFLQYIDRAINGYIVPFFELTLKWPDTEETSQMEISLVQYQYKNETAIQAVMRDITLRKDLEKEKLRSEIIEKANVQLQFEMTEKQKAEKKLLKSLEEKEVLLKEVHHRVKNNLQIISSILNLQSYYIKNEETKVMFQESQDRIKTMALVHENLYQSKDFSRIDLSFYIRNLVNNLYRSYNVDLSNIKLNLEVNQIYLNLDVGIPCGLILNELISNSFKYAFHGRKEGSITIRLLEIDQETFELDVSDDGVGMDKNVDFANIKSLGLQLVKTLVDQINGEISINTENGTHYRITFKPN
ncbi:MAG: PAS domain S-box protein [Bacteroidota bacterium]